MMTSGTRHKKGDHGSNANWDLPLDKEEQLWINEGW